MIALYALFLRMQVGTHSYFFSYSYQAASPAALGISRKQQELKATLRRRSKTSTRDRPSGRSA